MKDLDEIKKLLLVDLPKEAVKQHPTKTYLSSIKAVYVTERFNDVFGVGAWTIKVQTESVNMDTGMVVVKTIFQVPELNIYYESYGGNDNGGVNNKNFDLGDAYKGATTDGITKIGSYLGIGIKVFKGLSGDPGPKSGNDKDEDDNKKWLNVGQPAWIKAVSQQMPLAELRKYYKVSKANGEQYLKEITQNPKS